LCAHATVCGHPGPGLRSLTKMANPQGRASPGISQPLKLAADETSGIAESLDHGGFRPLLFCKIQIARDLPQGEPIAPIALSNGYSVIAQGLNTVRLNTVHEWYSEILHAVSDAFCGP